MIFVLVFCEKQVYVPLYRKAVIFYC